MPVPLLAAALPAVIGAGAGLIQGIGNAIGQKKADERANEYARQAQERANQQNIEFWKMQNDYNSPQAQMARLREAGLNPNLMYGNGTASAGNAGNIAPAKAADTQSNKRNFDISAVMTGIQSSLQMDNLRAQNTIMEQEAALKAAQTANLGANTARSKFDLELAEALKNTSLQAAAANLKKMEADSVISEINASVKTVSQAAEIRKIYYESLYAKAHYQGENLANKLKRLEIELNELGIQKTDPLYWRVLGRHKNALEAGVLKTWEQGQNLWNTPVMDGERPHFNSLEAARKYLEANGWDTKQRKPKN